MLIRLMKSYRMVSGAAVFLVLVAPSLAQSAKATPKPSGRWCVRVASGAAVRGELKGQLESDGYLPVNVLESKGKMVVYAGAYQSQDQAETALKALQKNGYEPEAVEQVAKLPESASVAKPSEQSVSAQVSKEQQPDASAQSAGPRVLTWHDNIADALAAADLKKKKRIIVFFYAKQSAPTQYYENEVFAQPKVAQALSSGCELVKVEHGDDSDLARRLQWVKDGTMHIFDVSGHLLNAVTTRLTAEEFLAKLDEQPAAQPAAAKE